MYVNCARIMPMNKKLIPTRTFDIPNEYWCLTKYSLIFHTIHQIYFICIFYPPNMPPIFLQQFLNVFNALPINPSLLSSFSNETTQNINMNIKIIIIEIHIQMFIKNTSKISKLCLQAQLSILQYK